MAIRHTSNNMTYNKQRLKPRKIYKNEELNIQTAIVQTLRFHYFCVFSIPNGTYIKNIITRGLYKKAGLTAGVADLQILLKNGKSIFVEVKTKKGTQQKTQKEFQKVVEEMGHTYLIWRSVEDAENWINTNLD